MYFISVPGNDRNAQAICTRENNARHAHPSNPRYFIICVAGKVFVCQMCPASLVFSDACQTCVFRLSGILFYL